MIKVNMLIIQNLLSLAGNFYWGDLGMNIPGKILARQKSPYKPAEILKSSLR